MIGLIGLGALLLAIRKVATTVRRNRAPVEERQLRYLEAEVARLLKRGGRA